MLQKLWAVKYRPSSLDGYIFQDETQKSIIEKFIQEQSIPNLMFKGHRGTGKTTLAYILKNALQIEDCDFLKLNASSDNSVDTIRYKITSFVNTMATGPFKLVLFDEGDRFSEAAQDALRGLTEDEHITQNARFILTCNNDKRVSVNLRSRFQEFSFTKMDKEMMLEKAAEILTAEKIKVPSIELLEQYINLAHPDFRKLIVLLEQNSREGRLQEPVETDSSMEYKVEMMEHLEKGDWEKARSVVCANVEGEEWIDVYKFLYSFIHEVGKFTDNKKWKQAIIIIADHLYKNALCADSEINFAACIIKLTEI